jgi:putative transposase
MDKETHFCRKNIRLAAENYIGRRWYFVTVCREKRQRIFRDAAHAEWLTQHLRDAAAKHAFKVHAYCIMPDHLHLLVEGSKDSSNLLAFMAEFKQQTAKEWRKLYRSTLWQKKFYDHILRRASSPETVAWYIWMNPVRKGLCQEPQQYPHSGSFTVDWKGRPQPAEAWAPPWKQKMPG